MRAEARLHNPARSHVAEWAVGPVFVAALGADPSIQGPRRATLPHVANDATAVVEVAALGASPGVLCIGAGVYLIRHRRAHRLGLHAHALQVIHVRHALHVLQVLHV